MKKEDISSLNQLVNSLKEAELKLEEFYNKKDSLKFNETKKLILNIQKEISKVLK